MDGFEDVRNCCDQSLAGFYGGYWVCIWSGQQTRDSEKMRNAEG